MSKRTLWTGLLVLMAMVYLASPAAGNDKTEVAILNNTSELLQQQKDITTALDAIGKKDDDLDAALKANTDAINGLSRSLAELKGAQTAFGSSISAVQTDVDGQFTGAKEQLSELAQRMNTLQEQMTKVQQTIQAIQAPPVQPATPPAAGGGAMPPPTANSAADQLWQKALADVGDAAHYRDAQGELSLFSRTYPTDPRVGDANYWLGYVLFSEKNYAGASDQFENFLDSFPDNHYVPDAEYWRAMSFSERGNKTEAISELRAEIKNFPDAPITATAQASLKQLQTPH